MLVSGLLASHKRRLVNSAIVQTLGGGGTSSDSPWQPSHPEGVLRSWGRPLGMESGVWITKGLHHRVDSNSFITLIMTSKGAGCQVVFTFLLILDK